MAQDPLTQSQPSPSPARREEPGATAPREALPQDVGAAGAPTGLGTLLVPEPAAPVAAPSPLESELRLPSSARADEPSAHAAYLARRHFGALDGLRAVGILAVVWHHTVGGPGRLGANLFFLLSGFLITTILVRERAKKGVIDVARFRSRRARRLYPLYFSVLLGYVGLVWLVEPAGPARQAFFAHLPAFATFTSNLFVRLDGEHVIFYFAWSLAAQEQFYLLWPLYLKHLSPRTSASALLSVLATVYLTRAGILDLALPEGGFLRALTLSVMPALLLGALAALAMNARKSFEALRKPLGSRWASSVLLATALLLWRIPDAPEELILVVLAALTVACVMREDNRLTHMLRRPALVHIGTVSYGIYLMHMLCHNAVERGLERLGVASPVLDFALTAALAVGVATLSHRTVENFFLPADKRRKAPERTQVARASR